MSPAEQAQWDRARDEAFEAWLSGPTLGAITARGLIVQDATGDTRHAFRLAYLQGRGDGAVALQTRVLAAANAPINQVPA